MRAVIAADPLPPHTPRPRCIAGHHYHLSCPRIRKLRPRVRGQDASGPRRDLAGLMATLHMLHPQWLRSDLTQPPIPRAPTVGTVAVTRPRDGPVPATDRRRESDAGRHHPASAPEGFCVPTSSFHSIRDFHRRRRTRRTITRLSSTSSSKEHAEKPCLGVGCWVQGQRRTPAIACLHRLS